MFKCLHSLLGYDGNFICVVSVLLKLNKTLDMMELLDFGHLTCVTVISHLVVPRFELSLIYSRSLSICDSMYIFLFFLLTATPLFEASIYFA
jgi:hypothetical protein